jgi:hypothetical protein
MQTVKEISKNGFLKINKSMQINGYENNWLGRSEDVI